MSSSDIFFWESSTIDINCLIQYVIPNIKVLEVDWKKGAFIVKPIEDWLDERQLIAEQDKWWHPWYCNKIFSAFFFLFAWKHY